MCRESLIIIFAFFIPLLLTQCISSSPVAVNRAIIAEQKSIEANFNTICKLMLKGDIKTVYDKYLSDSARKFQTYDDFVTDYNLNKKSWEILFRGATLKQISPEDKLASAIVVWGNGDSVLIEFSKENDGWKIHYLRSPATIFSPGGIIKTE